MCMGSHFKETLETAGKQHGAKISATVSLPCTTQIHLYRSPHTHTHRHRQAHTHTYSHTHTHTDKHTHTHAHTDQTSTHIEESTRCLIVFCFGVCVFTTEREFSDVCAD